MSERADALKALRFPLYLIGWAVMVNGFPDTLVGCGDKPQQVIEGELVQIDTEAKKWGLLRWVDPKTGAVCYADFNTVDCHGGER
jgi:hypothetical protein